MCSLSRTCNRIHFDLLLGALFKLKLSSRESPFPGSWRQSWIHMMMDERENDEKNVMGCRGELGWRCILPCSGLTLLPAAAQGSSPAGRWASYLVLWSLALHHPLWHREPSLGFAHADWSCLMTPGEGGAFSIPGLDNVDTAPLDWDPSLCSLEEHKTQEP